MASTTFELSGTASGLARLDTRDGYGVGWVASRCGTTTSSSPSHAPRHCIFAVMYLATHFASPRMAAGSSGIRGRFWSHPTEPCSRLGPSIECAPGPLQRNSCSIPISPSAAPTAWVRNGASARFRATAVPSTPRLPDQPFRAMNVDSWEAFASSCAVRLWRAGRYAGCVATSEPLLSHPQKVWFLSADENFELPVSHCAA